MATDIVTRPDGDCVTVVRDAGGGTARALRVSPDGMAVLSTDLGEEALGRLVPSAAAEARSCTRAVAVEMDGWSLAGAAPIDLVIER